MIRVLLADDPPVVQQELKRVLSKSAHITIAAEAEQSDEVMKTLTSQPVDVVLLDLSLRDRTGIQTLSDIKQRFPAIPVLVVSQYSEAEYGVQALRGGASGYLSKDCEPKTFHSDSSGGTGPQIPEPYSR